MKILTNFLLLLSFCLLFSCAKKDNVSFNLLRQAQNIVEDKPDKALVLLDSITNPQNMDTDSYMQYIVTYIQAKSKNPNDITNETLIFEAQKYFNDKNDNAKQAALANYYAACVLRNNKVAYQSLESYLHAGYYVAKTKDNKLSGKIYENIGALYFEQDLKDSAILNYQRAINYYNTEKNTLGIVRSTNEIGRAYEHIAKLDSAYIYFSSALQMAEKLNDEWYKSNITQNLALTTFGMGEYDKSVSYYKSALDMQVTSDIQKRQIYLYLLKIYSANQDANAGKEYAAKVESSLPEVTDLYTKKGMYLALADYHKELGDYKQALHFKELEIDTKDQIAKEERPAAMVQADGDFRVEQTNKQHSNTLSDFYFLIAFIVFALIVALAFVLWAWRGNKKDKKEIQLEIEKYDRIRERMREIDNQYPDGQAELDAILKEIEEENKKDSEGEL